MAKAISGIVIAIIVVAIVGASVVSLQNMQPKISQESVGKEPKTTREIQQEPVSTPQTENKK